MGFVSWTKTWKVSGDPSALFLIGPELKPLLFLVPISQGVSKSPCTTVWKELKKWNSSVSPTSAVIESGANVKRPLPTLIRMVCWATVTPTVAARRAIEECITVIDEQNEAEIGKNERQGIILQGEDVRRLTLERK